MSGLELRDGPVIVRHWRAEDAEAVPPLANDRAVWAGLRDAFPHPYALEDARRYIARAPETSFAIEYDGAFAGSIGLFPGTDVERVGAEIGYWIGRAFWGRGIATTALRLVTRHAFRTDPELERIFAVPYATNAASARVLEKAGYRREGTLRRSARKDGQVLDQWMYSILRSEIRHPEGR